MSQVDQTLGQMDVLLVIRAPLEQYPPSVNQIALLAEAGLRVGIVDLIHDDYKTFSFHGKFPVERFRPTQHTQSHNERTPNVIVRLLRAWMFRHCVQNIIKHRQPKVVLAYDPNGMWAVGPLWKRKNRPRLVWHFHELVSPVKDGRRSLTSEALNFACENAQHADRVVFPDPGRAEIFYRTAKLRNAPQIVMNCPRRLGTLPENNLAKRLADMGHKNVKVVYFHGGIGPSRCMENVIKSMSFWPDDTVFIMVGPVTQEYKGLLDGLASELGMAKRVLFFGFVPYEEIWGLAVGASVGVSIVADPRDLNWNHSAGAVNKRFEYMAVGLPQVTSNGPGVAEIIEAYQCGLCVNPTSSEEIGQAIHRLFLDQSLHRLYAESARRSHLDCFNYELQFSELQNWILTQCGTPWN